MPVDPRAPTAAPRRRWHLILLPLVALVVLLIDMLSKRAVQQYFTTCDSYGASRSILGDWLTLTYTCNHGAAFGLLANATLLFVLIALVVIGVIIVYVRFLPANRPWLAISLGLQLGGALGNLVDRLRQGYVVDFIAIKSLPVFNVADSCIVIGVLILSYHLLLMPGRSAQGPNSIPLAPPRSEGEGVSPPTGFGERMHPPLPPSGGTPAGSRGHDALRDLHS